MGNWVSVVNSIGDVIKIFFLMGVFGFDDITCFRSIGCVGDQCFDFFIVLLHCRV